MAKPVINYKGYMTVNPGDRSGDKICIPQIVDRNQVKTLESIVEEAIDRGLIAGLKASAVHSCAKRRWLATRLKTCAAKPVG